MRIQLSPLFGLVAVIGILSCSSGEPTGNNGVSLTNSSVSASTGSITADGASTATITVQLRNGSGTAITSSGGTVVMQATAGTLSGVTDHQNGSYTATLTAPTASGSGTVSAQLNGQALTSTAIVTFVAGAVDLTHSTLTAADSVITADGAASTVVTVRARDVHDNAVTGTLAVTIASTKGTVGSVAAVGGGVYTATLTSPTTVATGTVSAQINSQPLAATTSVRFAPGAVSLSHSTLTVADTVLVANGSSNTLVTVQAKDAHDNPVTTALTVTVLTTAGSVGAVSSGGGGAYTATLTSSTALVTATVSAKINAQALTSTAGVRFKIGPPAAVVVSAGNGQVALVLATLPATITVTVSDGFGHATAGSTVVFSIAAGGGSVTGATIVTDASGHASVGSWTMGAAFGTNTLTATAHVTDAASPVAGTANVSATAHLYHYAQSYDGNHAVATMAWTFGPHVQVFLNDENNVFFQSVVYSPTSNDAGCSSTATTLTCPLGTITANVVFTPAVVAHVANPSFQAAIALAVDAPPRIVFMSDRGGADDIYAMFPDGSGLVQLTNDTNDDIAPVWSPDRRKIAWYTNRNNPPNHDEIWTMNADSSGKIQVTSATNGEAHPDWSPDGTQLAYQCVPASSFELCIANADGSSPHAITSTAYNHFDPEWSPDGTLLLHDNFKNGSQQLGVVTPTGTGEVILTATGVNRTGRWSPDGTKIVFTSTRDGNDEIYVMNADGSGQTRLTNDSGDDDYGAWSPDGSKIIFASNRSGTFQLYTMNANGSSVVRLTNDTGNDRHPNWH